MRPLDLYRLGLRLSTFASTEAEQRNVVGRLYYGLHHEACCRYFRENPGALPLSRGSRHLRLSERYGSQNSEVAQVIARLLAQVSAMRNLADYELKPTIQYEGHTLGSAQLMTQTLTVAENLLTALDDFSPGEAPDGCDCPVQR